MEKLDDVEKLVLKTIGEALRQLRKKRELTQKRLAKKVNSHWTYISDIERGKVNFSVVKLFRISGKLGVKFLDIFPAALQESDEKSELINKINNRLKKLNMSQLDLIEDYIETFISSTEK